MYKSTSICVNLELDDLQMSSIRLLLEENAKKKGENIGNVMKEVVDHARQINLELDSDDVQELLDSHYQELTMDHLIEMHEREIDDDC
ncbi:hypothetical protein TNCV_1777061 [Trichonephila clavipes]|nr:hypothetical protein TNCV_1777061 [Trichonephila clavipes]